MNRSGLARRLVAASALGLGALGVASSSLAADPPAKPAPAGADTSAPSAKPADAPPAPPGEGIVVRRSVRHYTLKECLALADRNHPNLWAARARLGMVHAQLDEARWAPYFQGFGANANIGVTPPIRGTSYYGATPRAELNPSLDQSYLPFFQFSINAALPLYTFGKITGYINAAEAQVRMSEWDLERYRQLVRIDVRRAYFTLLFARDALYIAEEALKGIDKGLQKINDHLAKADGGYDEVDRLRLQFYRDELVSRTGDAHRGEDTSLAALRFLTGVQTNFDIPDETLKRPDVPVRPVVRYLAAARVLRPEVSFARSGVAVRRAQVDIARARFFPDIYLGANASYAIAPNAVQQNALWIADPFNYFGWGAALGVRWNLEVLPNQARLTQAESQLEEARAFERLSLGGIGVEVESAYASLNEAKIREEAWARNEHLAKGWLTSVRDAIDLGTKDERYLIEPTRFYIGARVAHVQSLMDYNMALSELARVSGLDSVAPDNNPNSNGG